ncbi:growth-regulating factor 4-like [Salvia hispanica]|uniref:growth-regulating factor 4-like n=1 Tax=Salvia hispanica TaxID=49212 RepID=UPI0020099D7D|nr:growth-regulating factor 4-like [Salvia hispanica]XP_047980349.1 growth-regulating factor 4-like [Salvia hispanica]XP_047980350.1 growth-regulating factor 4-like [Salvia hispanica]XP_047980351.1 growth-regulating factor 4-like [Salvia hispanica]XP_047980352.1 growth-regulating factor 4-like [Salvia hispanica]
MSEKAPISVMGMGAELGYRAPLFTDVQWKELEQQAMIYKYMVAGLPVPPDLVTPIRHSFEGLYAHLFNHPALGYCSYYGKKFDPEPGRCRRTDGKKWRCSKDAHPDSKYCERHMHRGRNRSRKPVESQSTSQSLLTAVPHSSIGGSINRGSSQQMPLYSGANSEGSSVGSNATKLQMGPYGREFSFSQEASGKAGSGTGTWGLMPGQVSSSSLFKQSSDSRMLGCSSAQQYTPHAYEPVSSKQQHGLFGSDISSPTTLKHEHLFFSKWPSTKESWSNLDNNGTNENTFSSTQLSMSTPSDFTSGTAYSPNDA